MAKMRHNLMPSTSKLIMLTSVLFHTLHWQTRVSLFWPLLRTSLLRAPMLRLPVSSAPAWPAMVCSTTLVNSSWLRSMCKGWYIAVNLPEEHPTASEFWQSCFSIQEIHLLSWKSWASLENNEYREVIMHVKMQSFKKDKMDQHSSGNSF